LIAGSLSGAMGFPAAAQVPDEQIPPPAATPVPPEAAPLEDEKLDQYATAYVQIEQIEKDASAQLKQAQEPETALAIKEKAEGAIIEAIERSGLKLDEFNQITEVASLDEGVRTKIVERVQKRRSI
jgi:hypothetical protein